MPLLPIRSLLLIAIAVVGTVSAAPVCEARGNAFLEPAVHHTNGMRVASSEAQRTASVNYRPNPDHLGYCSGYYFRPCLDSLRGNRIEAAKRGCYSLHCGPYTTSVLDVCPNDCQKLVPVVGSTDGVEPEGVAMLGNIPNEVIGVGIGGGVPAGAPGGRPPFGR